MSTPIRSLAALVALVSPVIAQDLKPQSPYRRAGFESIDPEVCREWLTYLASDELGGRETGTPGYEMAAKFIAKKFEEFGLEPVGDDGTYFQHVPFQSVRPNPERTALTVHDGTDQVLLSIKLGAGLGGGLTENSDRELDLVFLEAHSADDVEAADLEGKAVLLVDHSEPVRRGTEASRALRRAGATTVVHVDDARAAQVQSRIVSGGTRNPAARNRWRRPNTYCVTEAAAKKMRAAIEQGGGAVKLRTHVEIETVPAFGANVIGLLRGTDPDLSTEIVGIGSHLDHIGTRNGRINNGADDDGSGTTGVLAVARAFAKNPQKPRRSILFMCFSGEEKGLIGSRYYAENPVFPNEYMVAELQMDMIGRNEERVGRNGEVLESATDNLNSLHLVGTKKLSMALHDVCIAQNDAFVGFDFEYDEEDVFSRSDHASFARKDIPIAFFFTGFHPQYHQPDDTVDKIDFPKLARVAKLVYSIAFEVADADERPKRDRTWEELGGRRR